MRTTRPLAVLFPARVVTAEVEDCDLRPSGHVNELERCKSLETGCPTNAVIFDPYSLRICEVEMMLQMRTPRLRVRYLKAESCATSMASNPPSRVDRLRRGRAHSACDGEVLAMKSLDCEAVQSDARPVRRVLGVLLRRAVGL